MPSLPVLILNLAAYVSWNFGLFRPTRGLPRLLQTSPVLLTFSIGIMHVPSEHLCQEIVLIFSLDRCTMPQFRWWMVFGARPLHTESSKLDLWFCANKETLRIVEPIIEFFVNIQLRKE